MIYARCHETTLTVYSISFETENQNRAKSDIKLIISVIRFICSKNDSDTFTNVLGTTVLISRYQTSNKLDNSIVARNTWDVLNYSAPEHLTFNLLRNYWPSNVVTEGINALIIISKEKRKRER